MEYCKDGDVLNKILINQVIPQAVKIKETSLEHKPVNVYKPNSKEHNIYNELVEMLKEKESL